MSRFKQRTLAEHRSLAWLPRDSVIANPEYSGERDRRIAFAKIMAELRGNYPLWPSAAEVWQPCILSFYRSVGYFSFEVLFRSMELCARIITERPPTAGQLLEICSTERKRYEASMAPKRPAQADRMLAEEAASKNEYSGLSPIECARKLAKIFGAGGCDISDVKKKDEPMQGVAPKNGLQINYEALRAIDEGDETPKDERSMEYELELMNKHIKDILTEAV